MEVHGKACRSPSTLGMGRDTRPIPAGPRRGPYRKGGGVVAWTAESPARSAPAPRIAEGGTRTCLGGAHWPTLPNQKSNPPSQTGLDTPAYVRSDMKAIPRHPHCGTPEAPCSKVKHQSFTRSRQQGSIIRVKGQEQPVGHIFPLCGLPVLRLPELVELAICPIICC